MLVIRHIVVYKTTSMDARYVLPLGVHEIPSDIRYAWTGLVAGHGLDANNASIRY